MVANQSGVMEAYVAECSKEAESAVTNLTLVNVLIIVVLLVTLAANINEGTCVGKPHKKYFLIRATMYV